MRRASTPCVRPHAHNIITHALTQTREPCVCVRVVWAVFVTHLSIRGLVTHQHCLVSHPTPHTNDIITVIITMLCHNEQRAAAACWSTHKYTHTHTLRPWVHAPSHTLFSANSAAPLRARARALPNHHCHSCLASALRRVAVVRACTHTHTCTAFCEPRHSLARTDAHTWLAR